MSRNRVYSGGLVTGTITYIPTHTPTTVTVSPTFFGQCIDVSDGTRYPHPLSITKWEYTQVGVVTGQKPSSPVYSMDNYRFDNQGFSNSHLAVSGKPSDVQAITSMENKTNPSRLDVSVPNFIFELGDLPSMLKQKGLEHHAKSRSGGNSVAEANFGWGNLIGDLQKMTDITSRVDQRLKEISALKANGYRRRQTQFSQKVESDVMTTFQTFNCSISGFVRKTTHCRKWASCRWLPDPGSPPLKGQELADRVRQASHGWDFSGPGIAWAIWEAVPWSWFSDYFLNLQAYLGSKKNVLGYTASLGCVMDHTSTLQQQFITATSPGFIATPGSYRYATSSRVLVDPGIVGIVPILSIGQLTTLMGIAANVRR